ncbi:hypothetical protein EMIT048CA2_50132 [Pseudomonas chlororaphis]
MHYFMAVALQISALLTQPRYL